MRNEDFLHVMPLDVKDVPTDLLPREQTSIEVIEEPSKRVIYKRPILSGLGEINGGINIGSWQTVIITLGAFLTIYLIVCEMNRRK
jgi:hypothetical protein